MKRSFVNTGFYISLPNAINQHFISSKKSCSKETCLVLTQCLSNAFDHDFFGFLKITFWGPDPKDSHFKFSFSTTGETTIF